MTQLSRRHLIALAAAGVALPKTAIASAREIGWEDLIPEGVPYSEIIGEGELDEVNDTWAPIFDENATKLNEALNGELVRMPGFIIPLEQSAEGVTEFVLVPYVGACIHVPPPPPNQLVLVRTEKPWEGDNLWDAVWVEGYMLASISDTDVAQTGYELNATNMEIYVW